MCSDHTQIIWGRYKYNSERQVSDNINSVHYYKVTAIFSLEICYGVLKFKQAFEILELNN